VALLDRINAILWHDYVLFAVLATGVIFTVWSRFCQYRSLTRGLAGGSPMVAAAGRVVAGVCEPALQFVGEPAVVAVAEGVWTVQPTTLTIATEVPLAPGEPLFTVLEAHANEDTGNRLHRLHGTLSIGVDGALQANWESLAVAEPPRLAAAGAYLDYKGATLTARAFDSVVGGLGLVVVPLTAWLFAVSTMISWNYYGEVGVSYLAGRRVIPAYRLIYCALIVVSTTPLVRTEGQLDAWSTFGTGLMLVTNLPIILIFGAEAMRAYRDYFRRQRPACDHPTASGR
jgi:AGCS family alanine or glycine:cation symporter